MEAASTRVTRVPSPLIDGQKVAPSRFVSFTSAELRVYSASSDLGRFVHDLELTAHSVKWPVISGYGLLRGDKPFSNSDTIAIEPDRSLECSTLARCAQ
jgi:hypothetical protein